AAEKRDARASKFAWRPAEHVFPGRNPRMETLMPAHEEALPPADEYGQITGKIAEPSNGNGHPIEEPPPANPMPIPPQPEDAEDEEDAAKANAPIGPAVFKPGRHPRPGA